MRVSDGEAWIKEARRARLMVAPREDRGRYARMTREILQRSLVVGLLVALPCVANAQVLVPMEIGEERTTSGKSAVTMYGFAGLAGINVSVGLSAPGTSVLTLYGPGGTPIQTREATGVVSFSLALPQDGIYLVSVVRADSTAQHTLRLSEQTGDRAELPAMAQVPTFTPYTVGPELRNREEVGPLLEAAYPTMLRAAGVGGTALLWAFIDDQGRVRNTRVERSSGETELDAAAEAVMRQLKFRPAENRGQPVPVWIQLPITFQPAPSP